MKIIDLLNKIANGEDVPRKIKYSKQIFELTENKVDWYCYDYAVNFLGNEIGLWNLNDEIKILDKDYIKDTPTEVKKIEKVNRGCIAGEHLRNIDWHILDKLDEIIDRLNGEEND